MSLDNTIIPTLRLLQKERSYVLCCLDPEHKFDYKRVKAFSTEVGNPYQYIFADSVKALRQIVESRLFNIPNGYVCRGDSDVYPWHFDLAGISDTAMFAYDLSGLKISLHKDVTVSTSEFHFYEDSDCGPLTGLIDDDIPSLVSVIKGDSRARVFSVINYRPNADFPYQASPAVTGKFFYPMESFWSSSDTVLTL